MPLVYIAFSVCLLQLTACGHQFVVSPDDPRFSPVIPDVAAEPQPTSGSLFMEGAGLALYQDMKAHRVGDIITVKLTEVTKASKDAKTDFKKEYKNDSKNPTVFGSTPNIKLNQIPFIKSMNSGLMSQDIETKTEFKGNGDSSQNNSLTGDITVTVAQILPNKNLFIRGEKWITLNQGSEYLRLSGIVRPQDIGPNNEVESTRIADARITYSGKGTLASSNESGWIAKFFNSPWYPF